MDTADKKADYDVKVKAVDISPYPIARGKAAKFSISATTGTLYYLQFANLWLMNFESLSIWEI